MAGGPGFRFWLVCHDSSTSLILDQWHFSFLRHSQPGSDTSYLQNLRHIWERTGSRNFPLALVSLPQEYPFSLEAVRLGRSSLSDCQNAHPICNAARTQIRQLPKRVLDLSKSTLYVSLHVPSSGEMADYATLSYCWGISGVPLKTTLANMRDHYNRILINSFPATLRDAMLAVRGLRIRYLWIDALYIIQEGDGGQDWAEQAAEMTSIYQGGLINIFATDGYTCESGLRRQRFQDIRLQVGISSCAKGDVFLVSYPSSCVNTVDNGRPLSTRRWAFQERLVSPATLHFSNRGMVWECCTKTNTEREWSIDPPTSDHISKWHWNMTIQSRPAEIA